MVEERIAFLGLENHGTLPRTFQKRYVAHHSRAMAKELAWSQNWLRQHILGEYMKYRSYVKG